MASSVTSLGQNWCARATVAGVRSMGSCWFLVFEGSVNIEAMLYGTYFPTVRSCLALKQENQWGIGFSQVLSRAVSVISCHP